MNNYQVLVSSECMSGVGVIRESDPMNATKHFIVTAGNFAKGVTYECAVTDMDSMITFKFEVVL